MAIVNRIAKGIKKVVNKYIIDIPGLTPAQREEAAHLIGVFAATTIKGMQEK